MVFAFRVQAEYADAGRKFPVRVRLMDEDGGMLFDASGEMVGPPVAAGRVLDREPGLHPRRRAVPAAGQLQVRGQRRATCTPHETPFAVAQATQAPGPPHQA
jgi:hypothetical protein